LHDLGDILVRFMWESSRTAIRADNVLISLTLAVHTPLPNPEEIRDHGQRDAGFIIVLSHRTTDDSDLVPAIRCTDELFVMQWRIESLSPLYWDRIPRQLVNVDGGSNSVVIWYVKC
jgi:hypothetical protein